MESKIDKLVRLLKDYDEASKAGRPIVTKEEHHNTRIKLMEALNEPISLGWKRGENGQ